MTGAKLMLGLHCLQVSNQQIHMKKWFTFKCQYLRSIHSQTPITRVLPPGTRFSAESTDAMQVKYLD